MFNVSGKYVKIWKIFKAKKDDAKYVNLSVSTSEKNQDGEYENSSWYATAVGHAFQQWKAGDIKEGESYAIRGKLTNVRRQDDDEEWVDNYRLTIFDFAPAGEEASKDSSIGGKSKSAAKKTSAKKPAAKAASAKTDAVPSNDAEEEDAPW